MPDATITSTASTFGTISGTFSADQSTITGTVSGLVTGTLSGSVGVPGPQGDPGVGVPVGGTSGQVLYKTSSTDYATDWTSLGTAAYQPTSYWIQSPAVAAADGQVPIWDAATSRAVWSDNYATALEATVRNESGATMTKGTIVYISGASGNKPVVTKATASSEAGSSKTFAVLAQDIPTNQNGLATCMGLLSGLDTSGLTEGGSLWLSTTAGQWTQTPPTAPNHAVFIGTVTRVHANQGTVEVRIQNGYELQELHNVKITSVSDGQVLKYDSAQGLWVNGTDVGGVAWGGITGTLSSQTDLQSALDAKYDASNPSGFLTSSALTGYATESWVTSQDYIDSSALTPYVLATTAAATYQTLAGMSSYLTTSAAASTYAALATNNTFTANNTFSGTSQTIGNSTSSSAVYIAAGGTASGHIKTVTIGASGLSGSTTNVTIGSSAGTNAISIYGPTSLLNSATSVTPAADTNSTAIATTAYVIGQAGSSTPLVDGTASAGTSLRYSRQDHVHPTDTTRAPLASPTFTGTVTIPAGASISGFAPLASPTFTGTPAAPTATAGTSTTQLATTAFVTTADNLKANLASPTFTGTPAAPTAAADTNTTQLATTAYVVGQGYAKLASPALTGTPTAPTATAGTNTTQIATTAFVRSDNNVKAWVNFNGTGTIAIRASYNVSSITDNGVGDYTVNFTTAMSDANYSTASFAGDSAFTVPVTTSGFSNYSQSTTAIRYRVSYSWGGATGYADPSYNHFQAFR